VTGANATLTGAEPRCLECGYLLIGLPQERCPECGTAFTWAEVIAAAGRRGLPIEEGRGWRRLTGALLTWLLVLFRPIAFARRVDRYASLGLATLFAMACVAVGVGLSWLFVSPDFVRRPLTTGWAVGVLVHIELQSLLFLLVDLRWQGRWRQWMTWRKVSLYTTAFVALEWYCGPPMLVSYGEANFHWFLDMSCWESWEPAVPFPPLFVRQGELQRGAAYHWWLVVLIVILAVRLKRKWTLLVILLALPGVSAASYWAGYQVAGLFGGPTFQAIVG
jgi:hypothetical protein